MGNPAEDEFIVAEFLQRYLADEERGGVRSIEHYQRLFEPHAELIAREYAALAVDSGRIGPYLIERELGRGGQGTVYLAIDSALGRRVALKVLTGIRPSSVVERFRREAAVTSRLDHPGICTVYEAGESDGTPYIAMRYVDGSSLADRIRDSKATPTNGTEIARLRELAELIEGSARALHAAHEAGIIHRDVKPANIMVGADGKPVLMDFGLARELDGGLATLTRSGEFFGTPAYMAPEQLDTHASRADRRVDVWALGVTLYECMVLERPFVAPTREGLYRAILTEEPTDAHRSRKTVPIDLAAIVATALEKNPDRRYQTALDLADDLRRWLRNEPILAKPPSLRNRARKFVRRNRALVAGAAAVFTTLVLALIVTSSSLARSRVDAGRAKAMDEFLRVDLLRMADAWSFAEKDVPVGTLLDRAAARIEGRFDDPLVEGPIRLTLGSAYRGVGKYREAELHLRRAHELLREHAGPDNAQAIVAAEQLASLLGHLDSPAEGLSILSDSLQIAQRVHGAESELTVRLLNTLAGLNSKLSRFEEAERLYREALEIERRLNRDDKDMANTLCGLGDVNLQSGRFEQAEPLLLEAREICRRVASEEHPSTQAVNWGLVHLYREQGRYDEAEALCRRTLEIQRGILGEDHWSVLDLQKELGLIRAALGKLDDGEKILKETLDASSRALGDGDSRTVSTMAALAKVHAIQGQVALAASEYERVLERRKEIGDGARTGDDMVALAAFYMYLGRLDEAVELARESLEILPPEIGEDHPIRLRAATVLGMLYCRLGRDAEAAPLFARVVDGERRNLGAEHENTRTSSMLYGLALTRLERYAEAETALLAALDGEAETLLGRGSHAQALDGLVKLYDAWNKPELAAEYRARLEKLLGTTGR